MWLLSITLVVIVTLLFYKWFERKSKYSDISKIPGPPTHRLFGNILEFGSNNIDVFYNSQRMIKTYGPFVRIWQGPFRLNLFVAKPEYVEYFLSSNVHIKKSTGYDLFNEWVGLGLVTSSGDVWRKHRKILTPAFHFKILDQFSDTFHKYGQILVEQLKKKCDQNIDIHFHILLYALDTLCESSMRIDTKTQLNVDTKYTDAVRGYIEINMARFYSTLKRYDFFFQFTSDREKTREYINSLQTFTREVIRQRKEERKGAQNGKVADDLGIKTKKTFMDILLDSNQLTDEEIREEVDTFLFAGHDTVSSLMCFTIFELAKYPESQKTILAEIEEVVGSNKNEEMTFQHINDMNYLDRVVREVLRLYPPVPLYERELTEDIVLDGIRIPSGTTISFHPYAQHRLEELFPDPEKFDPDRFLPENSTDRHPFAYIPFSAGPRNCIGQKYAMLNAKTTVANVVRNFEIYPVVPAHQPILSNRLVLQSTNGLPIKLKLRK